MIGLDLKIAGECGGREDARAEEERIALVEFGDRGVVVIVDGIGDVIGVEHVVDEAHRVDGLRRSEVVIAVFIEDRAAGLIEEVDVVAHRRVRVADPRRDIALVTGLNGLLAVAQKRVPRKGVVGRNIQTQLLAERLVHEHHAVGRAADERDHVMSAVGQLVFVVHPFALLLVGEEGVQLRGEAVVHVGRLVAAADLIDIGARACGQVRDLLRGDVARVGEHDLDLRAGLLLKGLEEIGPERDVGRLVLCNVGGEGQRIAIIGLGVCGCVCGRLRSCGCVRCGGVGGRFGFGAARSHGAYQAQREKQCEDLFHVRFSFSFFARVLPMPPLYTQFGQDENHQYFRHLCTVSAAPACAFFQNRKK